MSTANRRERPWCYVKDMFCNHRCYHSFLAFNSIKEMEKQKEFEGCFSSGSLQVAQVCRKRLFLSKKAATSEGGMITLSRCDLSHIQSCVCTWTLYFSHWRMITALLNLLWEIWALNAQQVLGLAAQHHLYSWSWHWYWPLQGDALIYTGYKISSEYSSFRIRKIRIVVTFAWDCFQSNECCKRLPALFYIRPTWKEKSSS